MRYRANEIILMLTKPISYLPKLRDLVVFEDSDSRLVVVHIDGRRRTAALRTVAGPVILYENVPWSKLCYRDPIRCPYCLEGDNFKLMKARVDGQTYLCVRCGHLAMPKFADYQCDCPHCVNLCGKPS
jgi:hypothetical protein